MPYVKNISYRDMPFSSETPESEFYVYSSIRDLAEKCEQNMGEISRCRTVGILQSENGRFLLTDLDSPSVKPDEPVIRISMVYLKAPAPAALPYPVQIFGTLQWKNRPVIFASMLQVLSASTAIRVRNAMVGVTSIHLARSLHECNDEDDFT